jgi:hypothetical protein
LRTCAANALTTRRKQMPDSALANDAVLAHIRVIHTKIKLNTVPKSGCTGTLLPTMFHRVNPLFL